MLQPFCHLHVHDTYSLLDGFGKPEDYAKRAAEMGFQFLAVTNHGNCDSAIKFQNACKKENIIPIFGQEFYITEDAAVKEKGDKRAHITVLAKNEEGFQNILKMTTIAYIDGFYYRPRIDPSILLNHLKGLIVMTGCSESFLHYPWGKELFYNLEGELKDDLYLEIMSHDFEKQKETNQLCLGFYETRNIKMIVSQNTRNIKMIASQDCHYVYPEDAKAHEVLLAIQTKSTWKDSKRWRFTGGGYYLKSYREMIRGFKEQAIVPDGLYQEALRNTMEIAEKCSGFQKIEKKTISLPTVPQFILEDDIHILRKLCRDGFSDRIISAKKDENVYKERLEYELNLIQQKGFEKYFLIVWELIQWCKENDIMTGDRGSSAGSLVCYLLEITNSDPIEYNLLFERFISPERNDVPDIDTDFEDIKKPLIRKHLEELYGKWNVAAVSTFSEMKGKSAVRDVSRVFDVPLKEVNIFCKVIEDKLKGEEGYGQTIEDAIKTFDEGRNFSKKYRDISEIAIRTEGITRNCVDGKSKVMLAINNDRRMANYNIENLYKNKKEIIGKKIRAYDFKKNILFFDEINDIFDNGFKNTIEIELFYKHIKLSLTDDHLILTENGWKKSRDLIKGEKIAVNGKRIPWNKGLKGVQTPWNKNKKGLQIAWNKGFTKENCEAAKKSSERMKKNNPSFLPHVKQQVSERSFKHGLYSQEYISLPKFGKCEKCHEEKKLQRHHKDKNRKNNNKKNIMLLCAQCHAKEHKHDIIINPNMTIKFKRIRSIKSSGLKHVYDIQMKSENHNFVCNKIIVHNCSQHAAAVVVASEDLRNGTRCSFRLGKDKEPIINWDKEDIEYMGLMKLDILGLSTLSVLNFTKKLVKENHGIDIKFEDIDLNDPECLEEFSKGNNVGCFQVGTQGQREFCQDLGIDNFEMLVHATSLYRPGTLRSGLSNDFVNRKRGAEPVSYIHPVVEEITKDTYGIILYQEQLMQMVVQLAGMSWGTADKIRKVVAKSKGAEAFLKYQDEFVQGCLKNETLSEARAISLWNDLASMGSYSFCKSHAISYTKETLWTMYCKLNYSAEFICALLTCGTGDEDKKNEYIAEAFRLGIEIRPPKIGISDPSLWKIKNNILYAPFTEIKGIGDKTAIAFQNIKDGQGFYESGKSKRKIPDKFMKILDEIKAYDDVPVKDEEAEHISGFLSISIMKGPMGRYGKLYNLLSDRVTEEEFIKLVTNNENDLITGNILDLSPNLMKPVKRFRNKNILECNDCELRKECKAPVLPSIGNYNIMISGECPGPQENEKGRGFIGDSGNVMWYELGLYGYLREDFFITNVNRCFPGRDSNRKLCTPTRKHVDKCRKWLDEEIRNIKPFVVLALGNANIKFFTDNDTGIMSKSGTTEWNEKYGTYVCWSLHPASTIYTPENKELFQEGIKNFCETIKNLGQVPF